MTAQCSPSGSTPARPNLIARCPEDLLATVPVVLGFHPEESIVMLTFGLPRCFHARIDLPRTPRDLAEVIDALLDPVRRHGVPEVVLVLYTESGPAARRAFDRVQQALRREGVQIRDALRVTNGRWFPALVGTRPRRGTAYDISHHPFLADAVLRGQVTLPSREALGQSIGPDPEAIEAVVSALQAIPEPGGRSDQGISDEQHGEEVAWLTATVARGTAGTDLSPEDLARLLADLQDIELRDHAWFTLDHSLADAQVRFWTEVVRAAPPGYVAAPAVLLGFAAWLVGHGALAWCAVDRCFEESPRDALASALAEALMRAVPPSTWGSDSAADPE